MNALFKSAGTLCAVLLIALGGVEGARAESLEEYCHNYANDVARHYTGGDAVGGAVGGAAAGALIGAILGGGRGAARGAFIGGGTGLLFGGINEASSYQRIYEDAFDNCIDEHQARYDARYDGRGYSQPPQQLHSDSGYRAGAPEPWSDEWFAYCRGKYRSFDDETGYYLAYSGNYRFCQ